MLNTLRRAGIGHLLVHRTSDEPVLSVNPSVRWQETRNLHILEPVRRYYADREPLVAVGDLRLFQLDGADPMAFVAGDPSRALPIVRIPSGVEVDVSRLAEGGDVVINYLWYEGIRVRADGDLISSTADPYGRIQVRVRKGAQTLTVGYHSPWAAGTAICLGLMAIGAGWYWLLGVVARKGRRKKPLAAGE